MNRLISFCFRCSIVVVCFLFSGALYAQRKAPGYMGKRILLKYDQGISWSLGGDARAIPNFIHTLQFDGAVTKRSSVGVEYSFMHRKYEKRLGQTGYANNVNYRLDRTFMHKVGIYGKLFSQRNGHLAPAGPYFLIGLNIYFIQGKYSTFNNSNYTGASGSVNVLSFDFAPSMGGGKQYIVANRLVLSMDMRLSFPLIGLIRTVNNYMDVEPYKGTALQKTNLSLHRWTTWPSAQANFIELRIGFGTLL